MLPTSCSQYGPGARGTSLGHGMAWSARGIRCFGYEGCGGSRLEAGFQPWERVTPLAVSFSLMVQLRLTVLELKGAYSSR